MFYAGMSPRFGPELIVPRRVRDPAATTRSRRPRALPDRLRRLSEPYRVHSLGNCQNRARSDNQPQWNNLEWRAQKLHGRQCIRAGKPEPDRTAKPALGLRILDSLNMRNKRSKHLARALECAELNIRPHRVIIHEEARYLSPEPQCGIAGFGRRVTHTFPLLMPRAQESEQLRHPASPRPENARGTARHRLVTSGESSPLRNLGSAPLARTPTRPPMGTSIPSEGPTGPLHQPQTELHAAH